MFIPGIYFEVNRMLEISINHIPPIYRRMNFLLPFSFLLLALFLSLTPISHSWSINHRIVNLASNDTFYLIESDNTYIPLPDEHTAKVLWLALARDFLKQHPNTPVSHRNDTITEAELLSRYTKSPRRNPTLLVGPGYADDWARIFLHEIEYLEFAQRYWIDTKVMNRTHPKDFRFINPALVVWHGRGLVVSRYNHPLSINIRLSWLQENNMMAMEPDGVLLNGLVSGTVLLPPGEPGGGILMGGKSHEDPRALVLANGSLLVYYTATNYVSSKMRFTIGTRVEKTLSNGTKYQEVAWTRFVEMIHDEWHTLNQKNWVAFEHESVVYWYQFLNPFDVVAQNGPLYNTTDVISVDAMKMSSVYGIDASLPPEEIIALHRFPWDSSKYGTMRGGTPAVLIKSRNVRLSIFHSQAVMHKEEGYRRTYFMGAITHCRFVILYKSINILLLYN